MISDHAVVHLGALGHPTVGADDRWYNRFSVAGHGADLGPRRAGAENVPPIVAPGVLVDVAGHLGVEELEPSFPIGADELDGVLDRQGRRSSRPPRSSCAPAPCARGRSSTSPSAPPVAGTTAAFALRPIAIT